MEVGTDVLIIFNSNGIGFFFHLILSIQQRINIGGTLLVKK